MSNRPARIRYFDSVRLGKGTAVAGSLVITNTLDTPEQMRVDGAPVFEVIGIEGTSASGPMLKLEAVKARGRCCYRDGSMRTARPSAMRLVVEADAVELLP